MARDFRLFFWAEVTTMFGYALTTTVTSVIAVDTFKASATQIGFLTASAFVPAVAFGIVSGTLADRINRPRRVMIHANVICGLAILTVAAGLWLGMAAMWWLVLMNLVLGMVGTVVEPIYFTHLTQLVGRDDVVTGRARIQSGEYAATVIGHSLAGPALAAVGAAVLFALDAFTCVVGFLCLWAIRAPDRRAEPLESGAEKSSLRQSAADGFRELLRHRFLRALVGFMTAWSGVLGAVSALTPTFLLRTLGFPAGLYGLMFAFTGVAGLAGSLLGGHLSKRVSLPLLSLGGFGGGVLAVMLLPLASGPLAVAVTVGLLATSVPVLFGAVANIGLIGVLSRDVPDRMYGRVSAVMKTAIVCAQTVGALLGGLMGDVLGIRPALWFCCVVAVGCLLLVVPAARFVHEKATVPAYQ